MPEGPLGRREPTDFEHIDKYPLTALPFEQRPQHVPSPIGVNWYPEFDRPTKGRDGRWRVQVPAHGSRPRGGHCVCVLPLNYRDPKGWWDFYNQGQEGACVGFGISRAMSQLNRKRYNARWLYHEAQLHDEWYDTPPEEGTSVRAGLDILRTRGHIAAQDGVCDVLPDLAEGISVNRWATTIQDWLIALGRSGASEVPLANSWGRLGYPHIVWMPVEGGADRLLREDGEFSIITDR